MDNLYKLTCMIVSSAFSYHLHHQSGQTGVVFLFVSTFWGVGYSPMNLAPFFNTGIYNQKTKFLQHGFVALTSIFHFVHLYSTFLANQIAIIVLMNYNGTNKFCFLTFFTNVWESNKFQHIQSTPIETPSLLYEPTKAWTTSKLQTLSRLKSCYYAT